MNTIITSWITIFGCSVTHYPLYFFFALSFPKPAADFCANQKQTQSDVPRQTHLTAQTPAWQGVIDSTTPEHSERHNQTLSQEAEREKERERVHATQWESATSAE